MRIKILAIRVSHILHNTSSEKTAGDKKGLFYKTAARGLEILYYIIMHPRVSSIVDFNLEPFLVVF